MNNVNDGNNQEMKQQMIAEKFQHTTSGVAIGGQVPPVLEKI
jgi:hypothetical protein